MARIRTIKPFGIAPDAWHRASLGRSSRTARLLWVAMIGASDRGRVRVSTLAADVEGLIPDLTSAALGDLVDELVQARLVGYRPDGDLGLLHRGLMWRVIDKQSGRTGVSRDPSYRHLYADPCAYCGGPASAIDHIVPIASGGDDEDGMNLTAACTTCNSKKRAKPLLSFLLEVQT